MVAAASGSDDADDSVAADDATEYTSTEEEADEPGTIVDVAVGAGSFTTLVAAVTEAGLVDTLSGEGPFTVFAPTDEAFAVALGALGLNAEELLASDDLAAILTYHVVAGEVDAATAICVNPGAADRDRCRRPCRHWRTLSRRPMEKPANGFVVQVRWMSEDFDPRHVADAAGAWSRIERGRGRYPGGLNGC